MALIVGKINYLTVKITWFTLLMSAIQERSFQ